MTRTDRIEQIAELLREAGKAHHQAFIETDGADDEWPLWYADYLHGRLNALLEAPLTKSDLVYFLVFAAKQQQRRGSGGDWPTDYAELLLRREW
ncbi:MAG TPA: hypothetical protein VER55_00415 [Ardenticatenaceae bacterium]|nr:hypothetical protein [Ardenticatenaceae bacterium]